MFDNDGNNGWIERPCCILRSCPWILLHLRKRTKMWLVVLAVPCLRLMICALWSPSFEFDPRFLYVGSVMDEMTLFSERLWFFSLRLHSSIDVQLSVTAWYPWPSSSLSHPVGSFVCDTSLGSLQNNGSTFVFWICGSRFESRTSTIQRKIANHLSAEFDGLL